MLIQIDKKERAQAREDIGRFSQPSKLPCFAWSIPAQSCQTGSKLAKIKGSVCFDCYALKNFYLMGSTVRAMTRRQNTLADMAAWGENFVSALQGEEFFRWFDSGDLQSVDMLRAINSIALKTPNVRHWLPTKEHKIVRDYLKQGYTIAGNLTVRLSAWLENSSKVPNTTGYASLVFTAEKFSAFIDTADTMTCKAPSQEGKCAECRACWGSVKTIIYKKH